MYGVFTLAGEINSVFGMCGMMHNEQGFAMLGDLKNVKPGTAAD